MIFQESLKTENTGAMRFKKSGKVFADALLDFSFFPFTTQLFFKKAD